MLLLLIVLSLLGVPTECELWGDWLLGCPRVVLRLGQCQARVSWLCHGLGRVPQLGI